MKRKLSKVVEVDSDKCVNCHACIGACPVKYCNDGSGDHVSIDQDSCIGCGSCIKACTHEARMPVDDTADFLSDLAAGNKMVCIVAPSAAANFPYTYLNLNGWLKSAGAAAVFDVSFGAELTVKSYIEQIKSDSTRCSISSPCPALVWFIQIYHPELLPYLSPAGSPMTHTVRMIREFYREYKDYDIAAISPCLAKKREFERDGTCKYNVSMQGLQRYFVEKEVDIKAVEASDFDNPSPERAVLFSSPGGLMRTVERWQPEIIQKTRKIEGIYAIYEYLSELKEALEDDTAPFLVDCLSCAAGCNAGPGTLNLDTPLDRMESLIEERNRKMREVYSRSSSGSAFSAEAVEKVLDKYWIPGLYNTVHEDLSENLSIEKPSDSELEDIYLDMKKTAQEDFLDCGACGYGSCENMAVAIYRGLNRPENCHRYLQKLSEEERVQIEEQASELLSARVNLEKRVHERTLLLKNQLEENVRIKEQLGETGTRLQAILDTVQAGIMIVSVEDHKILEVNGMVERLFGARKEEIVGSECFRFLCPAERGSCPVTDMGQKVDNSERKVLTSDGREIPVLKTVIEMEYNGQPCLMESFVDISDYKHATEELKRISTAIEQTPSIVMLTDIAGKIIYTNPAFRYVTGYSSSETDGNYPSMLKSGEMSEDVYRELWKQIATGGMWKGILINRKKNGDLYWEAATISSIRDDEGGISGYLKVAEDISEKVKAQKELEKALEVKSEFISVVSHELRTPLTAIREGISIVLDGFAGDVTKDQEDFLGTAKRNVDRLTRLINDVLDFQKIENGKEPMNMDEMDLNEALEEVLAFIRPQARKKGLKISFCPDRTIKSVHADRDKIVQVVTNLLGNAVKFTEKGEIKVNSFNEGDMITVSVSDTGIGIRNDNIDKVFTKFEQLDKGPGRQTGSSGLGLAISRQIILAHKGRIWVESQYGRGSDFRFSIPVSNITDIPCRDNEGI